MSFKSMTFQLTRSVGSVTLPQIIAWIMTLFQLTRSVGSVTDNLQEIIIDDLKFQLTRSVGSVTIFLPLTFKC